MAGRLAVRVGPLVGAAVPLRFPSRRLRGLYEPADQQVRTE